MRRIAVTLALLVASLSFTAAADARSPTKHRQRVAPSPTQPDQVIQWNSTLLQILQTPGAQPATVHPTRSMAITQLAVYDAVNAIEGSSRPYLRQPRAPRAASPAAAAAAAAHRVLLSLFPSQQAVIDAKFQDSLSQIGGGEHVRRGSGSGSGPPMPSWLRARTMGPTPHLRPSLRSPARASTSSPRRPSASPCSRTGPPSRRSP